MTPFFNDVSWPRADRNLPNLLSIIFFAAMLVAVLLFFVYPWPVFTWQQLQELQTQGLPLYAFERGNLEFTISGENYIVFERWMGNPLQLNQVALDGYFLLYSLCLTVLLSIVSTLPRFWFYVGTMITAFLLSTFRWDALLLFGFDSRYAGLPVIALYFGLLFYYQFFRTFARLDERVVVFLFIGAVTGFFVVWAAEASHPLRLLAVNTIPSALVLVVVFIILIAHQVVASFVSLAISSSKTHGLRQFIFISIIYLLNLWLAYLNRIAWMDWDYAVPSFVLLAVSALLTVWTIRQRAPVYESLLGSDVLLVTFILAFATLSMATYAYLMATANDVVLLSLSDLTLYAHIGYGMMFLLYVISNFLGVFEKNLSVPKVLYKPTVMPYFTYRFAGLVFTLALVFYNNWMAHINHFTSGYYTALGDLYAGESEAKSLTYYQRAHIYSTYNQHASTALAELESFNGNFSKQLNYSVDANRFQPTEFTFLNTDHLYLLSGNAYEEIMLLRKAKKKFPQSGVILNNLGLAYSRVGMVDSASYYFRKAESDTRTRNTARLNLLGLKAKSLSPDRSDSSLLETEGSVIAVKSNALAFANHLGRPIEATVELPADSVFDLFSASWVANFLTNQTNRIDTSYISSCVLLARKPYNLPFRHMILPAAAKACYAAGQVNRAVQLMQEAVFLGTQEGANNYILGLMAMDQGKHDVAISYFLYALNHNFTPASLANAVCLAEEGRIDEAIVAWDTISHRQDTTLRARAESMKRVLGAPAAWFNDLTETEKLYYTLYRIPLSDSTLFNRLAGQIKDEDLRAKAFLNRARRYFTIDETILAARQYGHLQGLHLRDTELFAEVKYFELQLLAAQGRIDELYKIIDQGILFGPYRESERIYYEGLKYWTAGDTNVARQRFEWLARNNWYFDDGIVTASKFFLGDVRQSYHILSEALQVNPKSVKILKAYVPVALARGFDQYAADALQTLQGLISAEAFRKYVTENQLSGLLLQ
ncbi:MAG: hypothetical protein JNL40_08225 [Cyclobacteriaceae bacterium]|nr:hypothetical protein [Cyclobacteriaceae bacterium]